MKIENNGSTAINHNNLIGEYNTTTVSTARRAGLKGIARHAIRTQADIAANAEAAAGLRVKGYDLVLKGPNGQPLFVGGQFTNKDAYKKRCIDSIEDACSWLQAHRPVGAEALVISYVQNVHENFPYKTYTAIKNFAAKLCPKCSKGSGKVALPSYEWETENGKPVFGLCGRCASTLKSAMGDASHRDVALFSREEAIA